MLSEFANYELGEAFFDMINRMVVRDGIPFSKIGDFEIVSPSWRKLADKPDKTPAEIEKVDNDYKMEIIDLADSCAIYIASKTKNQTYQFNFEEYKSFLLQTTVDKDAIPENPPAIEEYFRKIKNQFTKLANHGEASGDDLIDNKDLAAYIYALDMKSQHDDNKQFTGFALDGRITPLNYAMAYKELKDESDNMFSFKLREAYKNLFGNNS